MSNVHEVQFQKPQADPDLVRMLEEWTERARSGELRAVGICGVKAGGGCSTEWSGAAKGNALSLISAASVLHFRMLSTHIGPD